jgi:hypothetical protein
MDWEFRKAEKGNIALTGEIDLPTAVNSPSPSRVVAAIRAQRRSCSNRWPSRLSRIANGMSASGSAPS